MEDVMQHRYHADGSIDFEFYRRKAAGLRLQSIRDAGRTLRKRGHLAAQSVSTGFSAMLSALLGRMFPQEPARPWAR
jgi:hypothetical protein